MPPRRTFSSILFVLSLTAAIPAAEAVVTLTLEKTAMPTTYSAVDQVISYSYVVGNTGDEPTLEGFLQVTDDKTLVTCPDLMTVGNGNAALDPGELVTCVAMYTITVDDLTAGSVTNTAEASAADPTESPVTSPPDSATVFGVGNIVIDKVTNPAGDPTSFTFTRNPVPRLRTAGGKVASPAFSLRDADPPNDSGPLLAGLYDVGELVPPGWVLTDISCVDPSGGTETSTATATATIDLAAGETVTCTFSNTRAAIEITKTAFAPQVSAGQTATFTIGLRNSGATGVSGLSVVDPLTPDCTRMTGNLPDLAPDGTTSYTCETGPLFASFTNEASVTASVPDGPTVSASASARVEVLDPVIEITKMPATQQILAGETADFTITVRNIGASSLVDIAVTDVQTASCARDGGEGTSQLPDLPPTGSISYNCVTGPLSLDLTNVATVTAVTGEGVPVGASASAFVEVIAPIEIIKSPSEQELLPGETATFTITLNNRGTVPKTGIEVSDPLTPACNNSVPTLAAGATFSYECSTGPLFVDFTNVATVTASTGSGPPVSASASALVNVLNPIELVKSPETQEVPIGGQATFTITVKNEGDTVKTGVAVSDPLSPDCDRPAGMIPDLEPNGGSFTYSCQSPALSADLLNVATVTAESAEGTVSYADSAFAEVVPPGSCFTGFTATGTGEATLCFNGDGQNCRFLEAAYIPLEGHPLSPPPGTAPAGIGFPHGLVSFRVGEGCTPGFTAEFSWELPSPLPPDTQFWKHGPTPDDPVAHWYVLPATVSGNVISFQITDGGLGDNDVTVDGNFADPAGVGVPAPAGVPTIPTLSAHALIALITLVLLLGAVSLPRRKT